MPKKTKKKPKEGQKINQMTKRWPKGYPDDQKMAKRWPKMAKITYQ